MATKLKAVDIDQLPPLARLRLPFPDHQISKLPKPTKKQTEDVKADFKKGVRCTICGSWHHPDVIHLDYVGHAALTDRLLDTDPEWSWEPVGFTTEGLPALDRNGGLWIKLTACGVTRFGYGCADGKSGGDAMKEIIGDALRNAAMRFGAALDLWHKGDLHIDHDPDTGEVFDNTHSGPAPRTKLEGPYTSKTALKNAIHAIANSVLTAKSVEAVDNAVKAGKDAIKQAERDWPELLTGDPSLEGDDEGLKKLCARRREELTPRKQTDVFSFLASCVQECPTKGDLEALLDEYAGKIEELDGEESRAFEELYNARESALKLVDMASAG